MTETAQVAPSLPPEALPPGADPAAYVAQQQAAAQGGLPEPALADPGKAAVPAKPDHVPAKFYNATTGVVDYEGMAKSYSALEAKLGAPKEEPAADAPPADQTGVEIKRPEADPESGRHPAAEAVAAIEAVAAKYADGSLADTDVADLSKKIGLPEANLQLYFEGLKAIETLRGMEAHEAAGGKDTFLAAQNWAAEKLTDAELEFYNSSVANPKTARSAVEWLVGKYNGANPSEGLVINPGPTPAAAGDVFRSTEEMSAAMSSDQYKRDPAFRQAVAEKIQRSKAAGTMVTGAQFFGGGF
ncbi:hypothetical protein DMC25_06415 [Caulobacter sp. D4A]|uniref:capsid assembly protein n=1 Tax=unclassified Caulobacter TaxID=2648921 RepID=UPI000D735C9F|nr:MULTISPECIES: hypothetical protein [unclassified Caulobacter]PXA91183.1 hypothetical protein DMC25_06415 [Caulobacter sp. D4A]PXA96796.1 hypothetical protein DMC18_00605 [Caulobacter sp. D5]